MSTGTVVAPPPTDVARAFAHCIALQGASDVHFVPSESPWIRFGGEFAPATELPALSVHGAQEIARWASNVGAHSAPAENSLAARVGQDRWRVTTFDTISGWAVACRLIPSVIPPIEHLGLPRGITQVLDMHSGLIVAAGGTGQGKTTTLAALIARAIRAHSWRLLTIEDPVEYLQNNPRSLVSHRQIIDDDRRQQALETAMRSDPDVVLFGEIRNREDARMTLEIANSGHLVFTTIHASDVAGTLERFASMTGDDGRSVLSQVLRCVIAQRLVPDITNPKKRHLAAEMMIVDSEMRAHIRPGGDLSRISTTLINNRDAFDVVLLQMVAEGKISQGQAQRFASNPTLMRELNYH